MKYDTSKSVNDFDEKPFTMDGQVVTFNTLLYLSVTTPIPSDAQASVAGRMELYKLASKIRDNIQLEMDAEDVSTIKKRAVAVVSSVIMFGRLIDFLENPTS